MTFFQLQQASYERQSSFFKFLFVIGRAIVSAFSSQLPNSFQTFGLVLGLILLIVAFIASALESWKGSSRKRPQNIIIALIAIMFFCFVVVKTVYSARTSISVNPVVFEEQLSEIKKLQTFLSIKDETGLREVFDFPAVLNLNIEFIKQRYLSFERNGAVGFDMTPYLQEGGDLTLDFLIAKRA
jgi:uncharacterized membrane protein YoaK (UPF0700 family)